MPLDFIYERYTDSYNLEKYYTSQDLLEKVRTGKGDPEIYTELLNIYVENFFGGYLSRTRVEVIK